MTTSKSNIFSVDI